MRTREKLAMFRRWEKAAKARLVMSEENTKRAKGTILGSVFTDEKLKKEKERHLRKLKLIEGLGKRTLEMAELERDIRKRE